MKLTNAQFSMQCAFIAKNAAAWAADTITLPERLNQAADTYVVARFTEEMRGRLDRLDEWARETAAFSGDATPPATDERKEGE
jgi:hypothetical protein